jgi:F-type H+-transporting ATPase subunit b
MTTMELAARLPEYSRSGMIDLDATMLVVLIGFILLMVALKALLFDPYLEIVAQRRAKTEGAAGAATDIAIRSRELTERLQSELSAARDAAVAERESLRENAKAEETKILAAAKAAAQAVIDARAKQVRSDVENAETELETQAAALASVMAQRIMPQA